MKEESFAYREPVAIGVAFRRSGKIYYFAPNGLNVRPGDYVVAETEKGVDIGQVVCVKYELPASEMERPLKPLWRKATAEDLAQEKEMQAKEREARRICAEKIAAHNLPMRLLAADYTFDGRRLTFYFAAEGRVDFRALVRDLAETFKTRIELRQVGVRDQAKLIGGLGPCGRPLCCNTFLRNFDPVSIRVAKDQGLALNPTKISGICDRLMCCLKFEHDSYCALAAQLPKVGQTVYTPKGPATVKSVFIFQQRLLVEFPEGQLAEYHAQEVTGEGGEALSEGTFEFGEDNEAKEDNDFAGTESAGGCEPPDIIPPQENEDEAEVSSAADGAAEDAEASLDSLRFTNIAEPAEIVLSGATEGKPKRRSKRKRKKKNEAPAQGAFRNEHTAVSPASSEAETKIAVIKKSKRRLRWRRPASTPPQTNEE